MANAWMAHLAKFGTKNKGKMSYSTAMKEAKRTYSGDESSYKEKERTPPSNDITCIIKQVRKVAFNTVIYNNSGAPIPATSRTRVRLNI